MGKGLGLPPEVKLSAFARHFKQFGKHKRPVLYQVAGQIVDEINPDSWFPHFEWVNNQRTPSKLILQVWFQRVRFVGTPVYLDFRRWSEEENDTEVIPQGIAAAKEREEIRLVMDELEELHFGPRLRKTGRNRISQEEAQARLEEIIRAYAELLDDPDRKIDQERGSRGPTQEDVLKKLFFAKTTLTTVLAESSIDSDSQRISWAQVGVAAQNFRRTGKFPHIVSYNPS